MSAPGFYPHDGGYAGDYPGRDATRPHTRFRDIAARWARTHGAVCKGRRA